MDSADEHEMELLRTDESGREEWHCPTCGRRFLMSWPPAYTKTVLVPGDVYATHLGGKGGLRMSTPAVTGVDDYISEPESQLDDDLLAPWRRAIDQIDSE
jgi:hypothetical protein